MLTPSERQALLGALDRVEAALRDLYHRADTVPTEYALRALRRTIESIADPGVTIYGRDQPNLGPRYRPTHLVRPGSARTACGLDWDTLTHPSLRGSDITTTTCRRCLASTRQIGDVR